MKPYYEQDGITIYHGDAMDVLSEYMDARQVGRAFDLLLTDPPYGISAASRGTIGTSKRGQVTNYGKSDWDDKTADAPLALARTITKWHVIFGGNFYDLGRTSCYLVWDKDNTGDFADCELAWTNMPKAVRKITYRWNGMLQQPGRPKEIRVHPTQKPEAVMVWALQHAPADVQTVLDPFMGSGTTLVAAKRLGKRATGIEREERYCEIAAKRLAQGALPMEFSA